MKKNVYLFQVNYAYGKSAHLPYAAAHLAAYAWNDPLISQQYELKDIFFLRKDPKKVLEKLENPFMVGFSTYVWNFEYCIVLASMIKKAFPACVILFGGHQVSPGAKLLEECPCIDYLIHGEGEEPLRRLMLSLIGKGVAADIPGLSYRSGDDLITNKSMVMSQCDFPSPYLGGFFDKILKENPDIEFIALIETSRGCPNSCTYCDWSNMKSKIRLFPLDRVFAEIEWMGKHHIIGLGAADSNFGFCDRDELIADKIVESYLATGYPARFQTSYDKNSSERVFRIGKKLDKYDMNKGITLSFQSMSQTVLDNIGRHNISKDYYSELMKKYSEAGVPTYTELILGLPGETYESFADGVDELLNLGQHNALYVHNCEWLPCSIMGTPDYMERYEIRTTKIPLNEPHRDYDEDDVITEWSQIVTNTYSMNDAEWKKMNLFSFCVQAFHYMDLTKFLAIYLRDRRGVSFRGFYEKMLEFFLSKPGGVAGTALNKISSFLDETLGSNAAFVCRDERFGKVMWPFEEYLFLCVSYELDRFYDEMKEFITACCYEDEVTDGLLEFQRQMVKQPFVSHKSFDCRYDFLGYFSAFLRGSPIPLSCSDTTVTVDTEPVDSWEKYARVVVWYGRKDGSNSYIDTASTVLK